MAKCNGEGKYRALSIFLCVILAVTQITDIGYGITEEDADKNIVEKTTDRMGCDYRIFSCDDCFSIIR